MLRTQLDKSQGSSAGRPFRTFLIICVAKTGFVGLLNHAWFHWLYSWSVFLVQINLR